MRKTQKHILLRITALGLVFAFFGQDLAWSAPLSDALRPVSLTPLSADLSTLEIPTESAVLKEIHSGPAGSPLVIHIQDAHANISGQENLAKTLDSLMRRYGVSLVLSEGGAGDCSLTRFKSIASQETWNRVAKSFLMQGKLAGEEYVNLTSEKPMKIVGVEEMPLYMKSVGQYAELADLREETLSYLKEIRRAVEKLKIKFYPQEILAYEKIASAEGGRFEEGFTKLTQIAAQNKVSLIEFAGLSKLAALKAREEGINFNLANLEQAALVEEISKKGGKEDLEAFLSRMDRLKNERVQQLAYFTNTLNIAKDKGIEIHRFENLLAYVDYLKEFAAIDLDPVLEEMEKAEDKIYAAALSSDDAKLLRSVDRYLKLLTTAYNIQMTTHEFDLFKANEPDYSTFAYLAFLNRKIAEQGYFQDFIGYKDSLERGQKALEAFYQSVGERDFVFLKNVEKTLADENQKTAVLITGGYHTPHLKQLLKEKGYSYAVVTPVVTSETNQGRYEKNLLAPVRKEMRTLQTTNGTYKKPLKGDDLRELLTVADASGARLTELLQSANPNGAAEALKAGVAATAPRAPRAPPTVSGARLSEVSADVSLSQVIKDTLSVGEAHDTLLRLLAQLKKQRADEASAGQIQVTVRDIHEAFKQFREDMAREKQSYRGIEEMLNSTIAASLEMAKDTLLKEEAVGMAMVSLDFTELNKIAEEYDLPGFGDAARDILIKKIKAIMADLFVSEEDVRYSISYHGTNILLVNLSPSLTEDSSAFKEKLKEVVRDTTKELMEFPFSSESPSYLDAAAFRGHLDQKYGGQGEAKLREFESRVQKLGYHFSHSLIPMRVPESADSLEGYQASKDQGLDDIVEGRFTPEAWVKLGEINSKLATEPFVTFSQQGLLNIDAWPVARQYAYYKQYDTFLRERRRLMADHAGFLKMELALATNPAAPDDEKAQAVRGELNYIMDKLIYDAYQKLDERKEEIIESRRLAIVDNRCAKLNALIENETAVEGSTLYLYDDQIARESLKTAVEKDPSLAVLHYRLLQSGRRNSRPIHDYHEGNLPRPAHLVLGALRESGEIDQALDEVVVPHLEKMDKGIEKDDLDKLEIYVEEFSYVFLRYHQRWIDAFVRAYRDMRLPEVVQYRFAGEYLRADSNGDIARLLAHLKTLQSQYQTSSHEYRRISKLINLLTPGSAVIKKPVGDEVMVMVRDEKGDYYNILIEFSNGSDFMRVHQPDSRDSVMHSIILRFHKLAHERFNETSAGSDFSLTKTANDLIRCILDEVAERKLSDVPRTMKVPLLLNSGSRQRGNVERMPVSRLDTAPGPIFALASNGLVLVRQKPGDAWYESSYKRERILKDGRRIMGSLDGVGVMGIQYNPFDKRNANRTFMEYFSIVDSKTGLAKKEAEKTDYKRKVFSILEVEGDREEDRGSIFAIVRRFMASDRALPPPAPEKPAGARLAETESIQAEHLVRYELAAKILKDGYYNYVGRSTFKAYNQNFGDFLSDHLYDPTTTAVVFKVPSNLLAKSFYDDKYPDDEGWTYAISDAAKVSQEVGDRVKKEIFGPNNILTPIGPSSNDKIGFIPAQYIDLPETLERNRRRMLDGRMDEATFQRLETLIQSLISKNLAPLEAAGARLHASEHRVVSGGADTNRVKTFMNQVKIQPEPEAGIAIMQRNNRIELLRAARKVFLIGEEKNLQAQGVEGAKGGLGVLARILLEGAITRGDIGTLAYDPDSAVSAAVHGPYYVVADIEPGTSGDARHRYIVPDNADKKYLLEVVNRAHSTGIVTKEYADKVADRIFTYNEFVLAEHPIRSSDALTKWEDVARESFFQDGNTWTGQGAVQTLPDSAPKDEIISIFSGLSKLIADAPASRALGQVKPTIHANSKDVFFPLSVAFEWGKADGAGKAALDARIASLRKMAEAVGGTLRWEYRKEFFSPDRIFIRLDLSSARAGVAPKQTAASPSAFRVPLLHQAAFKSSIDKAIYRSPLFQKKGFFGHDDLQEIFSLFEDDASVSFQINVVNESNRVEILVTDSNGVTLINMKVVVPTKALIAKVGFDSLPQVHIAHGSINPDFISREFYSNNSLYAAERERLKDEGVEPTDKAIAYLVFWDTLYGILRRKGIRQIYFPDILYQEMIPTFEKNMRYEKRAYEQGKGAGSYFVGDLSKIGVDKTAGARLTEKVVVGTGSWNSQAALGQVVFFNPLSAEEIMYQFAPEDLDQELGSFNLLVNAIAEELNQTAGKEEMTKILRQFAAEIEASLRSERSASKLINPLASLIKKLKERINDLRADDANNPQIQALRDLMDELRTNSLSLMPLSHSYQSPLRYSDEEQRKSVDVSIAAYSKGERTLRQLVDEYMPGELDDEALKHAEERALDEVKDLANIIEDMSRDKKKEEDRLTKSIQELTRQATAVEKRIEGLQGQPDSAVAIEAEQEILKDLKAQIKSTKESYEVVSTFTILMQSVGMGYLEDNQKSTVARMILYNRNLSGLIYLEQLLKVYKTRRSMEIQMDAMDKSNEKGRAQKLFFIERTTDAINTILEIMARMTRSEMHKLEVEDGDQGIILVVRDFMPPAVLSSIYQKYRDRIRGIVTDSATPGSHWVIVLQGYKNAPAILFVKDKQSLQGLTAGQNVALFVNVESAGQKLTQLRINPTAQTMAMVASSDESAEKMQGMYRKAIETAKTHGQVPVIQVLANTSDDPHEAPSVNPDGYGLVRTEVWQEGVHSAANALAVLSAIAKKSADKRAFERALNILAAKFDESNARLLRQAAPGTPITFRTLDLQWDKNEEFLELCLKHQVDPSVPESQARRMMTGFDFYRTPLGRRVLQVQVASMISEWLRMPTDQRPELRIMFPMVRSRADMDYVLTAILPQVHTIVRKKLAKDRRTRKALNKLMHSIAFGVMIENLDALKNAADLVSHRAVRFFSVGTNDLTNELMTLRYNPGMASGETPAVQVSRDVSAFTRLFTDLQPDVLRALSKLADTVEAYNSTSSIKKKLGFCGEIAGSRRFALFVAHLQETRPNTPFYLSMSENRQDAANFMLLQLSPSRYGALASKFNNPTDSIDADAQELVDDIVKGSGEYRELTRSLSDSGARLRALSAGSTFGSPSIDMRWARGEAGGRNQYDLSRIVGRDGYNFYVEDGKAFIKIGGAAPLERSMALEGMGYIEVTNLATQIDRALYPNELTVKERSDREFHTSLFFGVIYLADFLYRHFWLSLERVKRNRIKRLLGDFVKEHLTDSWLAVADKATPINYDALSGTKIRDSEGKEYTLNVVKNGAEIYVTARASEPVVGDWPDTLNEKYAAVVNDSRVAAYVMFVDKHSSRMSAGQQGADYHFALRNHPSQTLVTAAETKVSVARKGLFSAIMQAWSKQVPKGAQVTLFRIVEPETVAMYRDSGERGFSETIFAKAMARIGFKLKEVYFTDAEGRRNDEGTGSDLNADYVKLSAREAYLNDMVSYVEFLSATHQTLGFGQKGLPQLHQLHTTEDGWSYQKFAQRYQAENDTSPIIISGGVGRGAAFLKAFLKKNYLPNLQGEAMDKLQTLLDNPNAEEAKLVMFILEREGISEYLSDGRRRIYLELKSKNTPDNFRLSRDMFETIQKEHNISGPMDIHVWKHPGHMLRAYLTGLWNYKDLIAEGWGLKMERSYDPEKDLGLRSEDFTSEDMKLFAESFHGKPGDPTETSRILQYGNKKTPGPDLDIKPFEAMDSEWKDEARVQQLQEKYAAYLEEIGKASDQGPSAAAKMFPDAPSGARLSTLDRNAALLDRRLAQIKEMLTGSGRLLGYIDEINSTQKDLQRLNEVLNRLEGIIGNQSEFLAPSSGSSVIILMTDRKKEIEGLIQEARYYIETMLENGPTKNNPYQATKNVMRGFDVEDIITNGYLEQVLDTTIGRKGSADMWIIGAGAGESVRQLRRLYEDKLRLQFANKEPIEVSAEEYEIYTGISPDEAEKHIKYFRDNVRIMNVEDRDHELEFEGKSDIIVVSVETIRYMKDKFFVIARLQEKLNPDGVLFVIGLDRSRIFLNGKNGREEKSLRDFVGSLNDAAKGSDGYFLLENGKKVLIYVNKEGQVRFPADPPSKWYIETDSDLTTDGDWRPLPPTYVVEYDFDANRFAPSGARLTMRPDPKAALRGMVTNWFRGHLQNAVTALDEAMLSRLTDDDVLIREAALKDLADKKALKPHQARKLAGVRELVARELKELKRREVIAQPIPAQTAPVVAAPKTLEEAFANGFHDLPLPYKAILLSEEIAHEDDMGTLATNPQNIARMKEFLSLAYATGPMAAFWAAPHRASSKSRILLQAMYEVFSSDAPSVSAEDWTKAALICRQHLEIFSKVAGQETAKDVLDVRGSIVSRTREVKEYLADPSKGLSAQDQRRYLAAFVSSEISYQSSHPDAVLAAVFEMQRLGIIDKSIADQAALFVRLIGYLMDVGTLPGQHYVKIMDVLFPNEDAATTAQRLKFLTNLDIAMDRQSALRQSITYRLLEIFAGSASYFKEAGVQSVAPVRSHYVTAPLAQAYERIRERLESLGVAGKTVRYDFSGGDVIAALLMTNAKTLQFYDALPFEAAQDLSSEDQARHLEAYRIEKFGNGYNSTNRVWGVGQAKTILLAELSAVGATDVEIEPAAADSKVHTVRFKWSPNGDASNATERTLIYAQMEPQSSHTLDYEAEGDIYISKANHVFGLPRLKTSAAIVFQPLKNPVSGYDAIPVKSIPGMPAGHIVPLEATNVDYANIRQASILVPSTSAQAAPSGARLSEAVFDLNSYSEKEMFAAIREGKTVRLTLDSLKPIAPPSAFKTISQQFALLAVSIQREFGRAGNKRDVQLIVNELLKNAFVHGNKLDLNLPIFLTLRLDAEGKVTEVQVVDADSKAPIAPAYWDWAVDKQLTGRGIGVDAIRNSGRWTYKTEAVENGKKVTVGLITGARLAVATSDVVIAAQNSRFDWNQTFGNDHPLSVEIGAGAGYSFSWRIDSDRDKAKNHVAIELAGVEAVPDLVDTASRHSFNSRVVLGDAKEAVRMFGPQTVEKFYLLYPSPRPTQPFLTKEFFEDMLGSLKPGGRIILITESALVEKALTSALADLPINVRKYELNDSSWVKDSDVVSEFRGSQVQASDYYDSYKGRSEMMIIEPITAANSVVAPSERPAAETTFARVYGARLAQNRLRATDVPAIDEDTRVLLARWLLARDKGGVSAAIPIVVNTDGRKEFIATLQVGSLAPDRKKGSVIFNFDGVEIPLELDEDIFSKASQISGAGIVQRIQESPTMEVAAPILKAVSLHRRFMAGANVSGRKLIVAAIPQTWTAERDAEMQSMILGFFDMVKPFLSNDIQVKFVSPSIYKEGRLDTLDNSAMPERFDRLVVMANPTEGLRSIVQDKMGLVPMPAVQERQGRFEMGPYATAFLLTDMLASFGEGETAKAADNDFVRQMLQVALGALRFRDLSPADRTALAGTMMHFKNDQAPDFYVKVTFELLKPLNLSQVLDTAKMVLQAVGAAA